MTRDWMVGVCVVASGCGPAARTFERSTGSTAALIIVEAALAAPEYHVLSDDAPTWTAEAPADDTRFTVLGYDRPLVDVELLDAAGMLNWANANTPTEQEGPLPRPYDWQETTGSTALIRRAPDGLDRAERIALSGCPVLQDRDPRVNHGASSAAFVMVVPDEVWVLMPRANPPESQALRYTSGGGVERDPSYPTGLDLALGAADEDAHVVWYYDGAAALRSLSGEQVALPEGVAPIGLALDANQIAILDGEDRLHLYDRRTETWQAPRTLTPRPLPGPSACTPLGRDPPKRAAGVWLDGDGAGVALLPRSCELVRFAADGAVEPVFPDGPYAAIDYARHSTREAAILTRGRLTELYTNDDGRGWAVAAIPEFTDATVAVLGSDVVIGGNGDAGLPSATVYHGWFGQPGRARLECKEGPKQWRPLIRAGDVLMTLQTAGDPKLHLLRWARP